MPSHIAPFSRQTTAFLAVKHLLLFSKAAMDGNRTGPYSGRRGSSRGRGSYSTVDRGEKTDLHRSPQTSKDVSFKSPNVDPTSSSSQSLNASLKSSNVGPNVSLNKSPQSRGDPSFIPSNVDQTYRSPKSCGDSSFKSSDVNHSNKSRQSWSDSSLESSNVEKRKKTPESLTDASLKLSNVDIHDKSPQSSTPPQRHMSPDKSKGDRRLEVDFQIIPFDICKAERRSTVKLNKTLFEQNREKRKELGVTKNVPCNEYLRPGMVLLKNYIDHNDQVKIIKTCRDLGLGLGGFYTPGYKNGAKLNLQMMCLGKNWDPESRVYEDKRRTDGATPPKIPEEFRNLVEGAIKASHEFLRRNNGCENVEDELPSMLPDICIVNFYSKNGRLGLHQDEDESKRSLDKGLPVVSFSLGDSAEFLYGEAREADLAEKVVLESGDVLIFGGESRLLYHGVSTIYENTAPKSLNDTNLKPGRLNLTFRQY